MRLAVDSCPVNEPVGNLLIITYAFPPAGYAGVYRTLKYCKYLPECGWIPLVLTVRGEDVTFHDESLLTQVPAGVKVYRTRDGDPLKWLARRGNGRVKQPVGALGGEVGGQGKRRKRSRNWVKERILHFLTTPDAHKFWIPFALGKGIRILLREKIDLLYCSSPPHSSLIIPFVLSKLFRKRYVLDLRDPWGRAEDNQKGRRRRGDLEKRLKDRVLNQAAKIITVSRGMQEDLARQYPHLQEKITWISNGYDADDWSADSPEGRRKDGQFVMTFIGTIYEGAAEEFFAALGELVTEHEGIQERMEVNLVGDLPLAYAKGNLKPELKGMVRYWGFQPHARALRMMRESDLLLILLGGHRFSPLVITAKVFEYLASGKPILAVSPPGELGEILRRSGLGVRVAPGETGELKRTIWEVYQRKAKGGGGPRPDWEYIKRFEGKNLARQLAEVLHGI